MELVRVCLRSAVSRHISPWSIAIRNQVTSKRPDATWSGDSSSYRGHGSFSIKLSLSKRILPWISRLVQKQNQEYEQDRISERLAVVLCCSPLRQLLAQVFLIHHILSFPRPSPLLSSLLLPALFLFLSVSHHLRSYICLYLFLPLCIFIVVRFISSCSIPHPFSDISIEPCRSLVGPRFLLSRPIIPVP
ncbi:hypothetical protein BJX70DRAFT_261602 [Aspergillus crustosus]